MRREAGRGNARLKVFAPLILPLTSLIIKVLSPQAKYFPLTSAIRKIIQRYFTTMEIEKKGRIIKEFSSSLQSKWKIELKPNSCHCCNASDNLRNVCDLLFYGQQFITESGKIKYTTIPRWTGHCTSLNDDTKILTDTETFFLIPNFPKPKPRLFFRDQIFRNRNH